MKSFIASKRFILIAGIGWCLFFLWCVLCSALALTSKDIKVSCLPGTCLLYYNGKNMFIIKEAELLSTFHYHFHLFQRLMQTHSNGKKMYFLLMKERKEK
jgi:hypothetical protein